ncbi:MAG: hypothetical protein AVDCRST_MAG30-2135, partial [uncultured Solirubrobacteraceae bacterium]
MSAARPAVTVVVPSHGRPLRLRWLLNALEEQSLPRQDWELVVVTDDAGEETPRLLESHPLTGAGVLRHHLLPPGTGSPARQRNVGWRAARAPLVAFTDDDCRPDPGWLDALLAVAADAPGSIVQGATRPDPYELAVLAAPRTRTLRVEPPQRECPTCNVLYPRALLERMGGFDEAFGGPAGEDTDLAERARATGAALAAAPAAVVFHAVESFSLPAMVRLTWKWRALPLLFRRHPGLRADRLTLGLFWKRSHPRLLLALAGLAGARRSRALALLALPYLEYATSVHGHGATGVARAVAELPSRAVVDLAEVAAIA